MSQHYIAATVNRRDNTKGQGKGAQTVVNVVVGRKGAGQGKCAHISAVVNTHLGVEPVDPELTTDESEAQVAVQTPDEHIEIRARYDDAASTTSMSIFIVSEEIHNVEVAQVQPGQPGGPSAALGAAT